MQGVQAGYDRGKGAASCLRGMQRFQPGGQWVHRSSPVLAGNANPLWCQKAHLRGAAPCLQGMPIGVTQPDFRSGSSPALAGNADYGAAYCAGPGEQPRACGECEMELCKATRENGAAPGCWGMQVPQKLADFLVRRSPVLAGNAWGQTTADVRNSEKPRAGGECTTALAIVLFPSGEAPCWRGMQFDRNRDSEH